MRSIRTVPAAFAAKFESLGSLLSRHRAVTRVSAVTLAFTVVFTLATQDAIQAGPEPVPSLPDSILPQSIGIGIATDANLVIPFDQPMDRASVEAALQVYPEQPIALAWNQDATALSISAGRLWRSDERYVFIVGGEAATADGTRLQSPRRFSFTTETAPTIDDFQVRFAASELGFGGREEAADVDPLLSIEGDLDALPELDTELTAEDVSATSSIRVSFDRPMDQADTMARFSVAPAVDGELTWDGTDLVFQPTGRFEPGKRYTVSLVGAHDLGGNVIGGKANFSFVVRQGAQLMKVSPGISEANVESESIEMWFSQPMRMDITTAAITVTDKATDTKVAGAITWNEAATQVTFTPEEPFAAGHQFEVVLGSAVSDKDGNAVTRSWTFTPLAPQVQRSTATTRSSTPVVVPPAAGSSDMLVYAVNQINAARSAYGFGPVTLDPAITAVAYPHAYENAVNGTLSHTSADGRTREDRLREGNISFTWSGENQCYLVGRSVQATLEWCHAQFMAEPYPGEFNHIANILNPNARRVGVGIAQVGGRIVIVWDYTD